MKVISAIIGLGLVVAASSCGAAYAVELVTNGGFEVTTNGNGQLGYNTNETGWSVAPPPGSYIFLFGPGTADTTGANGEYGGLSLWGSNNGGLNVLPASPNGGNFVALDGDFQTSPLTQTISGLIPGHAYSVSFDYGYAQQSTATQTRILQPVWVRAARRPLLSQTRATVSRVGLQLIFL